MNTNEIYEHLLEEFKNYKEVRDQADSKIKEIKKKLDNLLKKDGQTEKIVEYEGVDFVIRYSSKKTKKTNYVILRQTVSEQEYNQIVEENQGDPFIDIRKAPKESTKRKKKPAAPKVNFNNNEFGEVIEIIPKTHTERF